MVSSCLLLSVRGILRQMAGSAWRRGRSVLRRIGQAYIAKSQRCFQGYLRVRLELTRFAFCSKMYRRRVEDRRIKAFGRNSGLHPVSKSDGLRRPVGGYGHETRMEGGSLCKPYVVRIRNYYFSRRIRWLT